MYQLYTFILITSVWERFLTTSLEAGDKDILTPNYFHMFTFKSNFRQLQIKWCSSNWLSSVGCVKLRDRIIKAGRSLWRSCSLSSFQVRAGTFPGEIWVSDGRRFITCGCGQPVSALSLQWEHLCDCILWSFHFLTMHLWWESGSSLSRRNCVLPLLLCNVDEFSQILVCPYAAPTAKLYPGLSLCGTWINSHFYRKEA